MPRPTPERPKSRRKSGSKALPAEPLAGRARDVTLAGDAVVETSAGLVMVRGALPGEAVRLRVERSQRGVLWGQLLELTEPSPQRVTPACALATQCGGCPLMTLAHPAQLDHKRGLVERALAGLTRPALQVAVEAAPSDLGYRRRARLAFDAGRSKRLGYRRAGSRELLDVPRCAVLEPALQQALDTLRAELLPALDGPGEVTLAIGREGRAVARVSADRAQSPAAYAAAQRAAASLQGLALSVEGGAPARWGETEQAQTSAAGQALLAAADGFAQANSAVNQRLVAQVCELARPAGAAILELYAGHGNLTVPLAGEAAELHAVELNAEAAQALRANLAKLPAGARTRVSVGPAERHLGKGPVDVVVLDPPRSGARAALAGILARRPARIVYVSCQPPTLRRDLQELFAGGYVVDAACALDMFPHTSHVEAVVRLVAR